MATFDVKMAKDNTAQVLAELESAAARALEACGMQAETFAKGKCPVDTGRLRGSITHAVDDDAAYIGTNVEYGKYVECGTSRMGPRPYLRPAIEDHSHVYMDIIEQYMKA